MPKSNLVQMVSLITCGRSNFCKFLPDGNQTSLLSSASSSLLPPPYISELQMTFSGVISFGIAFLPKEISSLGLQIDALARICYPIDVSVPVSIFLALFRITSGLFPSLFREFEHVRASQIWSCHIAQLVTYFSIRYHHRYTMP